MEESNSKLFKQRLFRIHSSVGIIFSLILYISLFFGIFTVFAPFINTWEKPSLHFDRGDINTVEYEKILESVISNPDYPKNNIFIELPYSFGDPTVKITHRFMAPVYFNPKTNKKIEINENTSLSKFIIDMHYGRPFKLPGVLVFGFASVAAMILIIGGIMLIIYLKYKNSGKNQQAKFSRWHRDIFLYTFPIFFIIVLTGALMNLGYKSAAPMTSIATKGESTNIIATTNPILKPAEKSIKSLNQKSSMLPLKELIKKATQINQDMKLQEFRLINWKDKTARIEFIGYNPYKPFLNGVYNKEKILLSAVDGKLIKDTRVLDASWSILFADSMYFIHLLYDVNIYIRIFVALLMFLTCLAIGFGVMLWLKKKAKSFDEKIPFYHWVSKFSLSIMLGVIPATAILFILQWTLPFDIEHRSLIQQLIFMNCWIATLTWSFYRIDSYKVAKEFIYLGAFLFISAAIIHFISSGFSPIDLIKGEMYDIFSVDISFIIFGILLILLNIKLPNNKNEAEIFWNKKQ